MKIFSSKYRAYSFLVAYVCVFAALALLGYWAAGRTHFVDDGAVSGAGTFTTDLTYYDIPRMTVSVGNGDRMTHVRIDMSLEIKKQDAAIIAGYEPRITAKLNRFLMNVDPDRVQEVSWLPWLRSEMLDQINSVGTPAPVHDLVFRQLVVM